MESSALDSKAFRDATLRSDRARSRVILAALAILALLTMVRTALFHPGNLALLLSLSFVFFGGAALHEFFILRKVNGAIRTGSDLGFGTWLINILVETLFPTLALMLLIVLRMAGPYQALVAPVVLVYFIFIALSTLRLSPILAVLSGVFSAAGYGAVVLAVHAFYPAPELPGVLQPVEMYAGNVSIILAAGLVAGAIARQIRDHVASALREAHQVERLTTDSKRHAPSNRDSCRGRFRELGDFEIAGWNKPADQTGGDYFGWMRLPDGRMAFTLADVTGHGISSALVASACHAYSRASMAQDSDLAAIVSRINRLLSADLPSGRLVTFVAGALDSATGRVELLSAGHAPLLLYTAPDDRVQSFDAHGVPLGIFGGMAYGPAQEISLGPGDMLVLITDGFFEWTNASDEDFGFERLHAAIRSARGLAAGEVIARLHEAVTQFAGGTAQADDLTAVVLKRRAGRQ